jgi:hypothetical protein
MHLLFVFHLFRFSALWMLVPLQPDPWITFFFGQEYIRAFKTVSFSPHFHFAKIKLA